MPRKQWLQEIHGQRYCNRTLPSCRLGGQFQERRSKCRTPGPAGGSSQELPLVKGVHEVSTTLGSTPRAVRRLRAILHALRRSRGGQAFTRTQSEGRPLIPFCASALPALEVPESDHPGGAGLAGHELVVLGIPAALEHLELAPAPWQPSSQRGTGRSALQPRGPPCGPGSSSPCTCSHQGAASRPPGAAARAAARSSPALPSPSPSSDPFGTRSALGRHFFRHSGRRFYDRSARDRWQVLNIVTP
jgi:hypothetical protein